MYFYLMHIYKSYIENRIKNSIQRFASLNFPGESNSYFLRRYMESGLSSSTIVHAPSSYRAHHGDSLNICNPKKYDELVAMTYLFG